MCKEKHNMVYTKCLYCGNTLDNSRKHEIKDRGFCCSPTCQRKAESALNKPFNFQLSKNFMIFLMLGIVLFFVNRFTLNLERFTEILGILWGVFIALLPFISKPIFPFSIKKSNILTGALGLFIIVMSIFSLIDI